MPPNRFLVLAGGLCGAAGVAFSAAAAHSETANTGTAASFLLMHAPVFLAIGLLGGNTVLRIGGWALLAGLLVFSGDLLMRDYAGFSDEWLRWFPTDPPARQGAKLPITPKGMKLSIAVIAEA